MAEFLVELYVSSRNAAAVERGAARARVAAEELTREGTPVRYLRSIFVPEDETCFYLCDACSADTVRAVASQAALRDIGKPGGILDAKDPLDKGPVLLITDPSLSANNPNNPNHTAGTTFFGQFLDHDITFDVGSKLAHPTDPETATNGRTPACDLDSVYGGGPVASPQLYDSSDLAKLRIEGGG